MSEQERPIMKLSDLRTYKVEDGEFVFEGEGTGNTAYLIRVCADELERVHGNPNLRVPYAARDRRNWLYKLAAALEGESDE